MIPLSNIVIQTTFLVILCCLTAAQITASTQDYHWPEPQYDALESLLYTGGISGFASNCVHRLGTPESPVIAAEWLRLAYHDMATHNVTAGTGGLDSSIYFELDRPENIGQGMIDSLDDFGTSSNRYISRADVIAMGAVWAVAGCNGPIIPFRGGRIDATGPGRAGVPEPQQDLTTHTESFRLQGFTPAEMIQLVTCGHTLGGVRNLDFPDIVQADGEGDDGSPLLVLKTFDSTNVYDTKIITEYLDGTTLNPLIVVHNVTLQSDLRIFSSDGNTTTKSMADLATFANTCKTLLGRMLETVPSGIQFTKEIKLLPFKVNTARILLLDSQILFDVTVRVATDESSPKNVTLLWCEVNTPASPCTRNNANEVPTINGASFLNPPTPLMTTLNVSLATYDFQTSIRNASVAKFWFEATGGGDVGVVVEDNGGQGYVFDQDSVILALTPSEITIANGDLASLKVVAGVQTGQKVTNGILKVYDQISSTLVPAVMVPSIFTVPFQLDTSLLPFEGYAFYSADITTPGHRLALLDFEATINGKQVVTSLMPISDLIGSAGIVHIDDD